MNRGKNQYQMIRAALHEQIDSAALSAGEKLPSERLLSQQFNTTRITLREALSSLESDGLIYREDRHGWFVSPQRLVYDPTINSNFHEMVTSQGRLAETRLIDASLIPASIKVHNLLKIPPLSPVYRLQRLRSIDQRKVLYVENYIKPDRFPDLPGKNLERSLSDVYRDHYQIEYARVHFQLYPVELPDEVAALLKVSRHSSGLLITRVNMMTMKRLWIVILSIGVRTRLLSPLRLVKLSSL